MILKTSVSYNDRCQLLAISCWPAPMSKGWLQIAKSQNYPCVSINKYNYCKGTTLASVGSEECLRIR